jgi:hypothetical protein
MPLEGHSRTLAQVSAVLSEVAAGVVAGTTTPLEATSRANAMNVRTNYQHDALGEWRDLHEELGTSIPPDRATWAATGHDRSGRLGAGSLDPRLTFPNAGPGGGASVGAIVGWAKATEAVPCP